MKAEIDFLKCKMIEILGKSHIVGETRFFHQTDVTEITRFLMIEFTYVITEKSSSRICQEVTKTHGDM